MIAALILKKLQTYTSPFQIATKSVNQELQHIECCFKISSLCKDLKTSRLCTLLLYNEFNKHSMVCYNAGYHYDRFDNGIASLENKVVFKVPRKHIHENALISNIDQCQGGGNILGEYHYAILDWGRDLQNRRQVAINMGIINNDQVLTQRKIDEFLVSNPNLKDAYDTAVNNN